METRFRLHYKNKPYRDIGVVRHSETQEELALYECLYPNDLATLWVRPREMYENNVVLNGKETARFRQVPMTVDSFSDLKTLPWDRLQPLLTSVFGEAVRDRIEMRLKTFSSFLILIGSFEGRDAGFKIAYQLNSSTFHSWLGGVLTEFRGLGVASVLLEKLETHARSVGASSVTTKTLNRWTDMLVLNLRRGFVVTGTEESPRGIKILLEKSLG